MPVATLESATVEFNFVPCGNGGNHEVDFLAALADRRRFGYDIANSYYFCGRCRWRMYFMEALSSMG